MTYLKDESTLKNKLHQSIFNKMITYETISNKTALIFRYLLTLKDISYLNKKISNILEPSLDIKENIQRCNEIEKSLLEELFELKDELESLTDNLEIMNEELINKSIRKINISVDQDLNIILNECIDIKNI